MKQLTDEDMESIRGFADCAFQEYGRVDAVVHCAAILNLASCEETGADQYSRVMDTDFLGMVRVNEIALPGMRQQGQGRIIMFSSIFYIACFGAFRLTASS